MILEKGCAHYDCLKKIYQSNPYAEPHKFADHGRC